MTEITQTSIDDETVCIKIVGELRMSEIPLFEKVRVGLPEHKKIGNRSPKYQ